MLQISSRPALVSAENGMTGVPGLTPRPSFNIFSCFGMAPLLSLSDLVAMMIGYILPSEAVGMSFSNARFNTSASIRSLSG